MASKEKDEDTRKPLYEISDCEGEKDEDTRKPLYEITDCEGTKFLFKKIPSTEKGTSLKVENSKENRENLCEVTSHDKTNKKKVSSKKKRRNKKITHDKASENKTVDPVVAIYKISNCDGKEVLKEVSPSEMAEYVHDKLQKPEEPAYSIIDYDENRVSSGKVITYELKTNDDTDKDEVKEESSHERTTCNEANKNEIPVKKESSHERRTCNEAKSKTPDKGESSQKTTCDEATKSDFPDKNESFDEKTISDEANNAEEIHVDGLFTLKNNFLIGVEDPIYNLHIGNVILHAFKIEPEFIGQVDITTGEQITFKQMRENTVKCALWLRKTLGKYNSVVKPIITICTRNPMNEYIPYLAALYLGIMVNPWEEDFFLVGVRVHYFLLRNTPKVIFVDDHNATKMRQIVDLLKPYNSRINPKIVVFGEKKGFYSLKQILSTEIDEKEIDGFSCDKLRNLIEPAILMFSSNATRYPGDAMIPYVAFVSPSNLEVPDITQGEIGLWYGSLCWTHSLLLTVRAIVSISTALKCPKDLFNEKHVYKIIQKYKVTWIFLESSLCNKMTRTGKMVKRYDVSSLKKFLFGDTSIEETIHEDLIIWLSNTSVIQVYCDSQVGVIAYQRDSDKLKCSGHVSKNVEVVIIDRNTKQIMGAYGRGEIWCKTPYSLTPYTTCSNQHPSMDKRLEGWYCTGDYGYFDEDGEIYIIDKLNHLIEYKNTIVSAAEIEEEILCDGNVAEAVVLPIQVANDGQHPVAFVKKKLNAKMTEKELKEKIEKEIETKMYDSCKLRGGVVFVNNFARLPNGKIDRQRIKFDANWEYKKILINLEKKMFQ